MENENTERTPYPKWIGVLLSFFLAGAAQFLSGARVVGIAWHCSFVLIGAATLTILCLLANVAIPTTIVLLSANSLLWILMLKQSYRHIRRIGFLGWVAVIGLSILLGNIEKYTLRMFAEIFVVPTGAMEPTIMGNRDPFERDPLYHTGDRVIVNKMSYYLRSPQRGEIAVFKCPSPDKKNKNYIKRIVGIPGDTVAIHPPYVIVNGNKLVEPSIFRRIAESEGGLSGYTLLPMATFLSSPTDKIKLNDDEYFVLGDNSSRSSDSRFWGPVPRDNFVGLAVRIVWPPQRMRMLE